MSNDTMREIIVKSQPALSMDELSYIYMYMQFSKQLSKDYTIWDIKFKSVIFKTLMSFVSCDVFDW